MVVSSTKSECGDVTAATRSNAAASAGVAAAPVEARGEKRAARRIGVTPGVALCSSTSVPHVVGEATSVAPVAAADDVSRSTRRSNARRERR